jgi:O-antigen/teichoic acid export membrane protein
LFVLRSTAATGDAPAQTYAAGGMTAQVSETRAQPAARSLRGNAVWVFLGQGGYAAGQWFVLIILAKLGGPALVGQFTLALAITGPIFVFSQLQMRQIQVVDAAGGYPFADYQAVRIGTTALALAVVAALAALGGYAASVAAVIVALGFVRAIESLSDIYYGLAQRHEQLDRVAQSMLLRSTLGCAVLGSALVLTGSLVAGLLAQGVISAAIWSLLDRRVTQPWRRGAAARCGSDGRALRRRLRLAWVGVPLGAALWLAVLNINAPRYVVEYFLGLEALGIFGALTHIVFAGSLVINAICQAASPRLANLFTGGKIRPFRQLLFQLCGTATLLGVAGTLVALLFSKPLLRLLYGPEFAVHAELLVWVMVASVVYYAATPLGYSLYAMHRFRVQPLLQGLALGVNVLACLILVPRYGLAGAVGGWSLAFVCQGLICFTLNTLYLRRPTGEALGGRAARPLGPMHPR